MLGLTESAQLTVDIPHFGLASRARSAAFALVMARCGGVVDAISLGHLHTYGSQRKADVFSIQLVHCCITLFKSNYRVLDALLRWTLCADSNLALAYSTAS